jgi:hypothetical protein
MDYYELMWNLVKIIYDKKMERYLIVIEKLMAFVFRFRINKKRKTNI